MRRWFAPVSDCDAFSSQAVPGPRKHNDTSMQKLRLPSTRSGTWIALSRNSRCTSNQDAPHLLTNSTIDCDGYSLRGSYDSERTCTNSENRMGDGSESVTTHLQLSCSATRREQLYDKTRGKLVRMEPLGGLENLRRGSRNGALAGKQRLGKCGVGISGPVARNQAPRRMFSVAHYNNETASSRTFPPLHDCKNNTMRQSLSADGWSDVNERARAQCTSIGEPMQRLRK